MSNPEDKLNADLRVEVLKYLEQARTEPQPKFPTEYAALMYVALGTLKLLHEGTMEYNKYAISKDKEPVAIDYFGALGSIVSLLESLAPQMQEPEEVAAGLITGKFRLS